MAMTITELKTLLGGISGQSYSLTAPQFGVESIASLFQTYVPQSALNIANPQPNVEALQLRGNATLGSAINVVTVVTFLADNTNTFVAGIDIKLDLASFSLTTPFANFSGSALQTFGFLTPQLVLSAGDKSLAEGAPGAFITGTLNVNGTTGTKTVTLIAQIPFNTPASRAGIENNYVFAVKLQDITLADLNALAQFIPGGADFNIIPPTIPLADTFALKYVEFAIDPTRNKLASLRLTVGSAKGMVVVPDVFEIKAFTFSFQIILPGVLNRVYGVIATALDVYGHEIDMALSLPDLYLVGRLAKDTPVKLKPFVSHFLPADLIPDNFELSELELGLGLRDPHPYNFDITLSNLWSVTIGDQELQMTRLSVSMEGVGSTRPGLSIEGQIEFAKTQVYLSAETKPNSQSWLFKGGTVDAGPIVFPEVQSAGVKIGDLLADLAKSFSIDVPDPVKSLELRNIQVSFETGTNAFTFHCTGQFIVESTPIILTVKIETKKAGAGYDVKFGGRLQIGKLLFDVVFDHKNLKSDVFIATYSRQKGDPDSVSLHELIAGLSPELAKAVPEGIDIQLADVKFVFYRKQSQPKQFAFGLNLSVSIDLSNLPVVGSRLPQDLSLKVQDLQLIYSSQLFPKAEIAEVNLLLPDTVTKFPADGLSQGINFSADLRLGPVSKHIAFGVPPAQPRTIEEFAITRGTAVTHALHPGEEITAKHLALRSPDALDAAGAPSSSMLWIDIQKQFGIFQFDRIGAGYENNLLSFALDAGVMLGPLTFTMSGLSVGSPLNKFQPQFNLSGLGLQFKRPPLEIGGAFLKTREQSGTKEITSYYGQVIVKAASFAFKAIGGWAPDADPASFFIYLSIDAPIGGPPFFFVTGLAGGMGINRSLRLPTIEELPTYLLLPQNAPKPAATPAATVANVLPQLQKIFVNQPGQYWVAAGIKFTSFEMIEAFVLLTVAFGVDLEIALLGSCAMTFPTREAYPVAYIEIVMIASFRPSTGLLAVDGKLSPASFIYGGFCKLSGGFAFYAWFSGPNKGNFVVSVGGYHPAFKKPDFYPSVPRLGMDFALGPFRVTGQAYFALTPSMMMAGIRMSAVWSSGPIKAWLDAGLDFLISWAPFHYEADAFINIGCSVDLGLFTLSVSVGAGLYIWGPPFGGRAEVDLDVVSFTISFGAEPIAPPPVGWNTFRNKFLPQNSKVPVQVQQQRARRRGLTSPSLTAEGDTEENTIKGSVSTGLMQTDVDGFKWILDPNHFSILTNSTIPANKGEWALSASAVFSVPNTVASYNPPNVTPGQPYLKLPARTKTFSETQVWNPTVNIAPMDQKDVHSSQKIEVKKRTESDPWGVFSMYFTELAVTPVMLDSNTALWGENKKPKDKRPNDPLLVPLALTGFLIAPIPRKPSSVNDVPLVQLLYMAGFSTGFTYQKAVVDPDYTVTSQIIREKDRHELKINISGKHTAELKNENYVLSSLIDPWVTDQRAAILNDLAANGFSTYKADQIDLHDFATKTALTDWPGVKMMGS